VGREPRTRVRLDGDLDAWTNVPAVKPRKASDFAAFAAVVAFFGIFGAISYTVADVSTSAFHHLQSIASYTLSFILFVFYVLLTSGPVLLAAWLLNRWLDRRSLKGGKHG
jgi:hypothetical protein